MTQYQGWYANKPLSSENPLQWGTFPAKEWDEDDIEVDVHYCGICGSDHSALSGHWGPVNPDGQMVCGHEVVGEVKKVGSDVKTGVKVGDFVGVGWHSDSCGECEHCQAGNEKYCAKQTQTFNGDYKRGNAGQAKSKSSGGFATQWRGPARFAIPIPAGLDKAAAAPMMCGGVTVWSPLKQYGAGEKGRAERVGVVGVGGLGHFAIQFADKLGAEVTAISRGEEKKEDAQKLGAKHYIAAGKDIKEGIKGHEATLDLIICTINPETLPVADYFPLLRPNGTFVLVGVVPKPLQIPTFSLLQGNKKLAGSLVGSPKEIKEMLDFAAKNDVHPWIQKYDLKDINKAMEDFAEGKPRFRFVLVNKEVGAKL